MIMYDKVVGTARHPRHVHVRGFFAVLADLHEFLGLFRGTRTILEFDVALEQDFDNVEGIVVVKAMRPITVFVA